MLNSIIPIKLDQRTKLTPDIVCVLVAIILLAIHALPAFFPVYVEGFAYFSDSLAIAINEGFLQNIDRFGRFTTEFFYYTRPGAIWILSTSKLLFPETTYKDVIPFFSLITIIEAIIFVRYWTKTPWWIAIISLCFFPIIIEAAFFTNDNIIALAFVIAAFLILISRPGMFIVFVAGVLISIAMLIRMDQVFNIGIAGLIILKLCSSWKHLLLRYFWFGVGIVLAQLCFHALELKYGLPPSYFVTRLAVAIHGVDLFARDKGMVHNILRDFKIFLIAAGPGILLILIGAGVVLVNVVANARHRQMTQFNRLKTLSDLGIYFVFPAIFYTISLGKYYDPRGFLIFAPISLALVAYGLNAIYNLQKSPSRPSTLRILGLGMGALALLLLVVPTPYHRLLDENESPNIGLTGRIWAYQAWRTWQGRREKLTALSQRVVDEAVSRERPVAITVGLWDDDRATQNALVLTGYAPAPAINPECRSAAETWVKNKKTVVLVRWNAPFLEDISRNNAVLYLGHALPCLRTFNQEDRLIAGLGRFSLQEFRKEDNGSNRGIPTLSEKNLVSLEKQALDFVGCTTADECSFLNSRFAQLERQLKPRVLTEYE